MDLGETLQINILIWESMVCLALGCCTFWLRSIGAKKKKCLVINEFTGALLLLADAIAIYCRGREGIFPFFAIRFCEFLVFFMSDLILATFFLYMCTQLFKKEDEKYGVLLRVYVVYTLAFLGMALVILNQFFGFYFSIDGNNEYTRGYGYVLAMAIPIAAMIIMLSLLFEYRNRVTRVMFVSLLSYMVLPAIGALLLLFIKGISLINIGIGISLIVLYIGALDEQNRATELAAITEPVTGLLNSLGYVERMNEMAGTSSFAQYNAFYMKVNRFDLLNRRYGNDVVNEIMIKYAKYLKNHTEADELIARFGGEIFTALIKKENTTAFLMMLAGVPIEIRKEDKLRVEVISAVAGGYSITEETKDGHEVMLNLEWAFNVAKNVQKKPVVFMTDELEKKIVEIHQMEAAFPRALRREEFAVYYQPKVSADTKMLSGAEALVRWERDGEIVPPVKFIPILEQNDSICELDFYMLEHVCREIRQWLDEGLNPPCISVNMSRRGLSNPHFAEDIWKTIQRFHVPIELVQIEITETLDEFPMSRMQEFVENLRSYGIAVALDDFGTGSASLNVLREINFEVLKIDKSFVDCTYKKDLVILHNIIQVAKQVGTSVIAEGVETIEQFDMLKDLGCDDIQGYLFDKPLPISEFEQRMRNRNYQK